MPNHPNRSKSRPVATCTDRAVIIGEARTEAEAVEILRKWIAENVPDVEIVGAKVADVMIDTPEPGQWRFPKAWIPVRAKQVLVDRS